MSFIEPMQIAHTLYIVNAWYKVIHSSLGKCVDYKKDALGVEEIILSEKKQRNNLPMF